MAPVLRSEGDGLVGLRVKALQPVNLGKELVLSRGGAVHQRSIELRHDRCKLVRGASDVLEEVQEDSGGAFLCQDCPHLLATVRYDERVLVLVLVFAQQQMGRYSSILMLLTL